MSARPPLVSIENQFGGRGAHAPSKEPNLGAVSPGLGRNVAFAPPLTRFMPDTLTYSVPLF